jgi:hypothetical protein
MKPARITNREVIEALFPLVDDDISTVTREEDAAGEVAEIDALLAEELGDLAELDALVEAAEREWAASDLAESGAVPRFTDPVRARRAHRRADRSVLRSLPVRVGRSSGEAA